MNMFTRDRRLVPIILYGAAAIFSAASFAHIQSIGLVNVLIDSQSHLLQALQVVKSITPGMSQLGFWPPLLRSILVPAVFLLPKSLLLAFGAYLTLLPLVLIGSYFLYGIARLCGASRVTSLLAPALFNLHPFLQYYASSALTEVPLVVMVLGATYYALQWSNTLSMVHLSLLGAFVSFATLSRFEGGLLVPLSVVFVMLTCWRERMHFDKLKAITLTYVFMAVLGSAFIVLYSSFYADSPFAFLSLGVERVEVQSASLRISGASYDLLLAALHVFYRASLHMHGAWLLWSFPPAVAIMLLLRRRWKDAFVLLFLASPAIFVVTMMALGRNSISVEELPKWRTDTTEPYGLFANTRYAFTWISAAILPLVLAIDSLARRRYLRHLAMIVLLPATLFAAAGWYWHVAFSTNYHVISYDDSVPPSLRHGVEAVDDDGDVLFRDYDGGRYLMSRYYSESDMLNANVPMGKFVYEGSYLYFDQAVREPWLFVRWIAIRHSTPDNQDVSRIKILRDMLETERRPEFHFYYELVAEGTYSRVYRLRENVLRAQAESIGYDTAKIPSLNPNAPWEPREIYEELVRIR